MPATGQFLPFQIHSEICRNQSFNPAHD